MKVILTIIILIAISFSIFIYNNRDIIGEDNFEKKFLNKLSCEIETKEELYIKCKETEEEPRRTISNQITWAYNFNKRKGIDSITFYSENTGGSGTFHYAIGYIDKRFTDPVFLGDRIRIEHRELNKEGDGIILEYIGHGDEDPLCCPNTKMSGVVRVLDDELIFERF